VAEQEISQEGSEIRDVEANKCESKTKIMVKC
jgi:hypothetical protein